MKNNNIKTTIIIFAGVAFFIALGYILRKDSGKFDWYEDYRYTNDQPYGGKVLSELLKNYFPSQKFRILDHPLQNELDTNVTAHRYNYIFHGGSFYTDATGVNALLKFVENGNTAFFSCTNMGYPLMEKLFSDTCTENEDYYLYSRHDSTVNVNFINPSLKRAKDYSFTHVFRNKAFDYYWKYFYDTLLICGNRFPVEPIGYQFNGNYNFIKVQYGKGTIYLHSTPILFSNYALLDKELVNYAEKTFSYLPEGEILWDEYSKNAAEQDYTPDLVAKSPIQFVLSEESLRWAWYIMLLTVLLYLFFFSKRKQRIIPVLPANTNTSLEYVQTIGLLYLQQRNNRNLCMHKMRLMQQFIRNRYSINTLKTDESVFNRLSAKSAVPVDEIKDIFSDFKWLEETHDVSNELLIQFHNKIEKFYKTCK